MSDRTESLTRSMLVGKASEARVGGPGLTGEVRRRGRRLVVRRRVTAGLACVAALAASIPSGAWLFGTGDRQVGPAGSIYGPAVQPHLPAKLHKITIGDVGKLKQGVPPSVPYVLGGQIHDGERKIRIAGPYESPFFTPVHDGYLVLSDRVQLVDTTGATIRGLPMINEHATRALPAVSADGRQIAWPEWDANGAQHKLVVGDATTGRILQEKVVTDVPFPYPVGFVGDKVVFAAGLPAENDKAFGKAVQQLGAGVTGIWDPESGQVSALDKAGTARGVDDFGHILTGTNPAQNCPAVYDAATGKQLWKKCGIEFSELSRAGLVIGEEGNVVDERQTRTVVLDAATGRRLLQIEGSYSHSIVWESDDDLLLLAGDRKGSAVVRCSLTGQCERATGNLPPTNNSIALPDKP
ncbi:hypothetical protein [Flindersiella endophytica]